MYASICRVRLEYVHVRILLFRHPVIVLIYDPGCIPYSQEFRGNGDCDVRRLFAGDAGYADRTGQASQRRIRHALFAHAAFETPPLGKRTD
jgi:hypothetical protein